jgi:tRNA A-37 threonylcarbamoyl transferase component Bud32
LNQKRNKAAAAGLPSILRLKQLARREIRYLASDGIHPREIKGVSELDEHLPQHWVFYTGLQYFPGHDRPIEMDLIILADDRVLLVEIKDWAKSIRYEGSHWVVGRGSRRPNPVKSVGAKARVLKTLIRARLPNIPVAVDSCVVLTATPVVTGIPQEEGRRVLSLARACDLGDAQVRRAHLERLQMSLRAPEPWRAVSQFDEVFGDQKSFRSQEAEFSGFRIVEDSVFVHPRLLWREHRAEEIERAGTSALLRQWDFARLSPAVNTGEHRRFLAERERRVFEHLNALGSRLTESSALLRPVSAVEEEIGTDHFDLFSLPATWSQAGRFTERMREALTAEDTLDTVAELLRIVGDLHDQQITHRDIGTRNIWIGGPARLGLTGFTVCQLPTDASVSEWRETLVGYSDNVPEDINPNFTESGFRRDVYQVGIVAKLLIGMGKPSEMQEQATWLTPWLERALSPDPALRYATVRAMADDFAIKRAEGRSSAGDASRLAAFETDENPYVRWLPGRTVSSGQVHVYEAVTAEAAPVIVKIWLGLRSGMSLELDLALLRLLEGASRLKASPIEGLPTYEAVGHHLTGPFVVYRKVQGERLDQLGNLGNREAVSLATQLLRAIEALHSLGYWHGDLSPHNILVERGAERSTLTVVDLFDVSTVGDGRKRTIAYCPEGHEGLGEKQIDRYAAVLIARDVLKNASGKRVDAAIGMLDKMIAAKGADPLEFALEALLAAEAALDSPPAPGFAIAVEDFAPICFEDQTFMLRRFGEKLVLTADEIEIEVIVENDQTSKIGYVGWPSHKSLEGASFNGVTVVLTLAINAEGRDDLQGLTQFLLAIPTKELNRPSSASRQLSQITGQSFPVKDYWKKVMELEDSLLPELLITGESETSGRSVTFPCERTRGTFDFDPLDVVDVFVGDKSKSIGSLHVASLSDESVTFLKEPDWPLRKGDHIRLMSRRSWQSFDKRKRAIDRILTGASQIPDLVEYFDPMARKATIDYADNVKPEDLDKYKLNAGQRDAILHVLRHGPVGLVQGPPGTGKTHFIAALTHWLTTKGGADKILLVSQSHEAVNAALETLIKRFAAEKNKLPLLRIGTKGISEKIRPYHSDSLRERFRASFEGSMKHRVSIAARGAGISRNAAYAGVDIERQIGSLSRRLSFLESMPEQSTDQNEIARPENMLASAQKAFEAAGRQLLGRPVQSEDHVEVVASAYRTLGIKENSSPADLQILVNLLSLSQEWLKALGTRYRNFDEFLVKTRSIVAGTCVGVGQTSLKIDSRSFDWVIIDEAARCTAGELAVAAQLGRRVLLVGDHLQLLPMIDREMMDELAASFPDLTPDDLARSDFERAFASAYGSDNRRVLSEQYRMNPAICEMVTDIFYSPHGVELRTSDERQPNTDFDEDMPAPYHLPIAWLDTSEDPRAKESPNERESHANEAEVDAVVAALDLIASDASFVGKLRRIDEDKPIGVICMYDAQREAIEIAIAGKPWDSGFRRLIKIETVDSYQGKENTIVIVSLSRTNTGRRGGHVSIPNRVNVAFSRAKERLLVVGSATFWGKFDEDHPIRAALDWIGKRKQQDGNAQVFKTTELFGR